MSKLVARTIAEEQIPDEHRDWVRSAIIGPFNKAQKEIAALANSGLLVSDNLAAQVFTIKVQVPDDWQPVAYQNGWVDFDSLLAARYRKDANGIVWVKGRARSGSASTIFTLPTAYRPPDQLLFAQRGNSVFASVQVNSTGAVFQVDGTTADCSFNLSFVAADRSPVPAACWPVSIACALSARPAGVVLWSAQDLANPPSYLPALGAVDWTYATKANSDGTTQGSIKIRNVPGLAPGKKYALTFAAFLG